MSTYSNNVIVRKVHSNIEALTNAMYINHSMHGLDSNNSKNRGSRYYIQIDTKYYEVLHDSSLDERTILMNSIQRRENDRTQIHITNLKKQVLTMAEIEELHRPVSNITVTIKKIFTKSNDSFYSVPEINREDITLQISEQLRRLHYLGNRQSYLLSLTLGCDEIHCQIQTSSLIYNRYKFYPAKEKTKIDVVNETEHLKIRDQNLFKFEDIRDMGVGGLSKEFEEMFRRAFASRTLDPITANELGIKHIRGIMLYGPPGCGKTLMARQISKSMNSVDPIIINGPELMSKFVGETEENLRKVFAPAEAEYKTVGSISRLHVIIFDEIDSICTHRGSNSGSTGVGDRIVNQLLTKLDGVEELNNIMVIGLTNRLDLIDKALLRPGRFEVQIEIGLPDKQGRIEILNIHTAKLRRNRCLDPSIDIEELAELTSNYTGAEIEGLINSARSYALCREIDADKLRVTQEKQLEQEKQNSGMSRFFRSSKQPKSEDVSTDKLGESQIKKITVTHSDIMLALREVKPAFGKDEIITGLESGLSAYGVFSFSAQFQEDYDRALSKLHRFNSSRSILSLITICGSKGSGKTTLALDIAKKTNYPLIKFVDQSKLVGLNEYAVSDRLNAEFKEAKTSQYAVIVVDDLERLIGYSSNTSTIVNRTNMQILSSLLTLVDDLEKSGSNCKYVVIFTGTVDVIKYITDHRNNLIDPRSVRCSFNLPDLPLFNTETPTSILEENHYINYEEYLEKIRALQALICEKNGVPIRKISVYDLFDDLLEDDDLEDKSIIPSSIPMKYYIEIFNETLTKFPMHETVEDNEY
jgi:SpoVK/Ycf46/Vps4 family AAA+-type ATPase